MNELALTRGFIALLDPEDFERFAAFHWHANVQGVCVYARRHEATSHGRRSVYLHREVLGAPTGMVVDHINGDTLDNRRSNLRLVHPYENQWNRGPRHGTSRFKGVHWHVRQQAWTAGIRVSGVRLHLGYFRDEEEAAHAYDVAASQHFNGLARLNFPAPPKESSHALDPSPAEGL